MGLTLRLNGDDNAKLRETAERESRSMHEIVVTALREYFARHDEYRAKKVRRFLAEDAELLELLTL
ncbi:hypothetical protein AB0I53_14815 [Saccharopolyspora sp. NPDC050389]|uniref:hypothetical protein n=1 Tax=Saccharopolyspora sp. NPDC050389 TaxID=3155516 RepID=UPI0033F55ACF